MSGGFCPRTILTHSENTIKHEANFVCQNISACLKLNRLRLAIVYCFIVNTLWEYVTNIHNSLTNVTLTGPKNV